MHKRCVFLEHAVGVTGLSNVQVIRDRAEVILLLCRAFKLARLVCAAEIYASMESYHPADST